MPLSRRRLLEFLGSAGSLGLAGCLGGDGGSNVEYPDGNQTSTTAGTDATTTSNLTSSPTPTTTPTPTPTPTTNETSTPTPTPTPTETPSTDVAVPGTQSVSETTATGAENVYQSFAWFTEEYGSAIQEFVTATNRAERTIIKVRRSSTLTENQINRLQTVATNVARVVNERLLPHFTVDDALETGENAFLEAVKKYARRGDLDAADDALERMREYYHYVGTDEYIKRQFSRHPIHNRLWGFLAASESSRVFFEVGWKPTRQAESYVVRPEWTPWGRPLDNDSRDEYDDRFAAMMFEEGRVAALYVVAGKLDPRASSYVLPMEMYQSNPIAIQRYTSVAAARRAMRALLEGPVTQEDTEPFGHESGTDETPPDADEWRRVYYYDDGDIGYAYMVQAGRHILAANPGSTPWENRSPHEKDPLRRTWVWR